MRRRLLALTTGALSVLLLALIVPLVTTYSSARTQDMFVDRQADLNRFAVVAGSAIETGSVATLRSELDRYEDVHATRIVVVDADRQVVAASSGDLDPADVPREVSRALAGNSAQEPPSLWPWSPDTYVAAAPIGRDAHVLGAVVMEIPTDTVRTAVATRASLLLAGGLLVLLIAAGAVAVPLVRWILRPVDDLDEAARRVAHGDLTTRVPVDEGPPELRRLASSFNEMAGHVETSQRQQRELVADASHQLGNPLTALRLRIETLNADAPPETTEQLDLVLTETDRLTRLVDSLLDLGQIGADPPALVSVDVAAQVRERAQMWSVAIPGLTLDVPERAVALTTTDVVDVVLDAALDNATKFAGGSPVDVRLTATASGVELVVRDHGPGVPEADIDKVGARFFRGSKHQNVRGTGLGLAIVRAHVEHSGGSFSVRTPAGGGFEVVVSLRAAPPDG